jgi:hypothetical protein
MAALGLCQARPSLHPLGLLQTPRQAHEAGLGTGLATSAAVSNPPKAVRRHLGLIMGVVPVSFEPPDGGSVPGSID